MTTVGIHPRPATPPAVSARAVGERIVAGAALVVLLPLLFLLGLAVRATMGAPVLFIQARSGYRGETFPLVKFRTMTDARDRFGRLLPDERRVTAVGRLLRRTRIDELPELWNIVRGEMAFVGPRPLLPVTVLAFGDAGRARGTVRPGLTGWAQVSGNTRLSDQDKLALDLWYIDHRSLRLDALVLVRSLGVVLFGEKVSHADLERARRHARDRRRRG